MDLAELGRRVQTLEDVEALKKLKARCSLLVDQGERNAFADLFIEDGEFIGAVQTLRGRKELSEVRFWPFMVHYVSNPIIEVNGDRATGVWYFLRPYTAPDGRASWASGIYEDEYVRLKDGWRFKSIKITNYFACPHELGWASGGPLDLPVGATTANRPS